MKNSKFVFIIGVLGVISGIGLMFTDSWFIGISGSIASAGLVYMHYHSANKSKIEKK